MFTFMNAENWTFTVDRHGRPEGMQQRTSVETTICEFFVETKQISQCLWKQNYSVNTGRQKRSNMYKVNELYETLSQVTLRYKKLIPRNSGHSVDSLGEVVMSHLLPAHRFRIAADNSWPWLLLQQLLLPLHTTTTLETIVRAPIWW